MQQAKNWQQQQTQNASMRPGVTQGLAAAEKAAGVSKTEFLVDTAPPRAPAAPQPAVSQTAPLTFEEAAPEPPPAPVETPAASEVGAASEKHECDRCGWDRRVPFNIEATEEDIRGFCVAVLSGKRFYKRVPLFDGRLAVTFRTLSSYEGQLVFTQLRYDVENRVVTTDVEYLARMSIYRLMLGTESIVRADSMGNVIHGYGNTIPVSLDEITSACIAVKRGTERAMVIADMPFGTYHVNEDESVKNALRLMKYGGAEAVKLEGGRNRVELVQRLVNEEIPVVAHIGFSKCDG